MRAHNFLKHGSTSSKILGQEVDPSLAYGRLLTNNMLCGDLSQHRAKYLNSYHFGEILRFCFQGGVSKKEEKKM